MYMCFSLYLCLTLSVESQYEDQGMEGQHDDDGEDGRSRWKRVWKHVCICTHCHSHKDVILVPHVIDHPPRLVTLLTYQLTE